MPWGRPFALGPQPRGGRPLSLSPSGAPQQQVARRPRDHLRRGRSFLGAVGAPRHRRRIQRQHGPAQAVAAAHQAIRPAVHQDQLHLPRCQDGLRVKGAGRRFNMMADHGVQVCQRACHGTEGTPRSAGACGGGSVPLAGTQGPGLSRRREHGAGLPGWAPPAGFPGGGRLEGCFGAMGAHTGAGCAGHTAWRRRGSACRCPALSRAALRRGMAHPEAASFRALRSVGRAATLMRSWQQCLTHAHLLCRQPPCSWLRIQRKFLNRQTAAWHPLMMQACSPPGPTPIPPTGPPFSAQPRIHSSWLKAVWRTALPWSSPPPGNAAHTTAMQRGSLMREWKYTSCPQLKLSGAAASGAATAA